MNEIEVWKSIPSYEKSYEASNLGNVRSINRTVIHKGNYRCKIKGKILSQHLSNRGYLSIMLWKNNCGKNFSVHALIAKTYLGLCPRDFETSHINGIKTDNRVCNLEYKSHLENIREKEKHGTIPKGINHPNSKLTEEDVKIIRSSKKSNKILAKRFPDVTESHIRVIRRLESWRWLK